MLPKLDPLLHSELRLALMSILAGVGSADFSFIKKQKTRSCIMPLYTSYYLPNKRPKNPFF